MTDKRTLSQNSAMWLYFELLAETLNATGWEMKKVLAAKAVDVPWSKESIKSVLWVPVQEAMLNKESTTELSTVDVDRVYRVLDRHITELTGVSISFPSARN